MLPATAPFVSTRSTSAPGTIAPVGSATTPLTAGDVGGGGLELLAAEKLHGTNSINSISARAKERMVRILQDERKKSSKGR